MRSAIAAANVEVKHQTAEAPPNDIKLEECVAYGVAEENVKVPDYEAVF